MASKLRQCQLQLDSDMRRLSRERENDMRMLKNEKQRFLAKYSNKLDMYIDAKSNRIAGVRMYDTHNPGFCYKRNGECRVTPAPTPTPTVNYDGMYALIFTNGEVDVDKILCLHLLTAHRTETLKPPPRSRINTAVAKQRSPVERLIERSKKKHAILKDLPLYVLDVRPSEESLTRTLDDIAPIRDGRLAARLLINDKVVQLVGSVISALKASNPGKVKMLIEMAEDMDALRNSLGKPHIQEFIQTLNHQMLISSCESFHLTPPFRVRSQNLRVHTELGHLEDLVVYIRRSVLYSSSAHSATRRSPRSFNDEKVVQNIVFSSGTKRKQSEMDSIREERSLIGKSKKSSKLDLYEFNAAKIAILISKKAEKAAMKDREESTLNEQSEEDAGSADIQSDSRIADMKSQESISTKESEGKIILKQTLCDACSSRWKEPTVQPKSGKLKKDCIPVPDETSLKDIKTDSLHLLSNMIEKEYSKLSAHKISRHNAVSDYSKVKQDKVADKVLGKLRVGTIDLNELDLAKIRQKIKENETKKKLEKFSLTTNLSQINLIQ